MVAKIAGAPRRERAHRELALRRVEQHALDTPGRRRRAARRAALAEGLRTVDRRRRSRSRPTAWATATRCRYYAFPSMRVVHHFLPDMPLRVSALRALGAYLNVFALESFMDELAPRRGADPVEFRLRAPRGSARAGGRSSARRSLRLGELPQRTPDHGSGFAIRALQEHRRLLRAWPREVAGRAATRGRIRLRARRGGGGQRRGRESRRASRNQIEGGILQSASWTLHEKVAFDRDAHPFASTGATYPILRFDGVPESHRGTHRRSPRRAVPRQRRGGAGPDRGGVSAMPWRMRRGGGCATCRWISAAPRRWRRSIGPESRSPARSQGERLVVEEQSPR